MKFTHALIVMSAFFLWSCSKKIPPANSGIYDNETVELKLEHKGEGAYTGTMKTGDKSYPVTGNFQGNTFTGSFKTDDMSFDLKGTLKGTTLTLDSSGVTYVLEKRPQKENAGNQ